VIAKRHNFSAGRLPHVLDKLLEGAHPHAGNIKWIVNSRPVGAEVAATPEGISSGNQIRVGRRVHHTKRPGYCRWLRNAVRNQVIFHAQERANSATSGMARGMVADFQTLVRHGFHLPPGQVPVLARPEGIKVTDIERATESE